MRLSAHTARAFHYPAKGGNIKWLLRSRFRVLFVKVSPLLQEVFPVEVRVRIQSGAWVSSDFCFREPLEFVLLCLEHPFSVSLWLPIPAHDPPASFVGMSTSAPTPCHRPDVVIQFTECLCGNIVAVVVCPASDDRIENFDKSILCPGLRFLCCFPDLIGDRFYRLSGWLDEQFSVVFSGNCSPESRIRRRCG